MRDSLGCLYVCYLSLDDPLVHSQVVAYLDGLARRGHTVHLLTFDTPMSDERRSELNADLERRGITWHSRRYHKRPSLPATVYDATLGAFTALRIMRRHGLNAIHARNHVPAATALIVKRLSGCRMIFDLRGLMAEEYVDAGIWRRDSLPYRLTNWIQRAAIRRADGQVMLTEAVRRQLFGSSPNGKPLAVIPCCADLSTITGLAGDRDEMRAELEAGDRSVMVYVGKFPGGTSRRRWSTSLRLPAPTVQISCSWCSRSPTSRSSSASSTGQGSRRRTTASRGRSPTTSVVTSLPRTSAYRSCGPAPRRSRPPQRRSASTSQPACLWSPPRASATWTSCSRARTSACSCAASSERPTRRPHADALELAADPEARERCRQVARDTLSLEEVGVARYDELYRQVARA